MYTASKTLFALLTLSISSYASAYGYLTDLGGPGVTIKRYFVHNEGGVSLILNENLPHNPDGCRLTNHVYIKGDKQGHKAMVSAALAAFASGKQIGLHGYGCEIIPFWGGTVTRPTVSELWVIQ
jgi:hypothetical protein